MSKITFNHFLLIIVIFLVGIVTYVTYLFAFDANPPVEYYNVPFPTDKTEYRHGEEILVTVDYCKNTSVPFVAHLRYVNGLVFSVPEVSVIGGETGCNTIVTNIGPVPQNLPIGEYYILVTAEYKVNFIATRTVEWRTTGFDVVP